MDYIKKMINKLCKTKDNPETDTVKTKEMNTANSAFKGLVKNAATLAACGLVVVSVAAAVDAGNTGAEMAGSVEETSSDDGSAPGRYLTVQGVETQLVQSAELDFKVVAEETDENVKAEVNTIVADGQDDAVSENETEAVTEQPTASAQGNTDQIVSEAENHYIMEFSEKDYEVLCTIVEAEAGDQDDKGKILVANVIINRVMSEKFPDNITDVVFQKSGKTYQFSPTRPGGRYYKVTATESTIACVERALKGEDYSEGAMFFAMKTSSKSWFNTSLKFLFKHGDHYFYTYR